MRLWIGFAVGLLVRLWGWTWRLSVQAPAELQERPCVLAFWHGTQMPLSAARPRGASALVSWSADGQLSAGVMRALGLVVARGSSSRGGAGGLRAVVRSLRSGRSALFAVDGPRGPLHRAKAGAAQAARLAQALLVPVGVRVSRSWVLRRTWDRFVVPWPFARVVIVAGPAVDPVLALHSPEVLERAIAQANEQAAAFAARRALHEASACPP